MNIITENRRRWVEALRSGEYEQGRFALRRANEFCCLGVACDVLGSGEWSGTRGLSSFDAELYTLSIHMRAKLGLTDLQVQELALMNDYHHHSFEQIADHIEALP